MTYFSDWVLAAVRSPGARSARAAAARARRLQRGAERRRRSLPVRLLDSRRIVTLRGQPPVLARPATDCAARRSHHPRSVDELAAAAIRGDRLESARARAARSRPRRPAATFPHGADRRCRRSGVQHRARPARRRSRAPSNRDVDRSRRDFTKDYAGLLSGDRRHPAALLMGFDPSIREPGYDPAGADRLFDRAGWRRGPDGMRRRGRVALHVTYVQFPETATGVRVATGVAAALRERGVDVGIKARQQRAALSSAHRRPRARQLRHRVRALDDGRRSRRLGGARLRRALELHALVRSAGRASRTRGAGRNGRTARKRLYGAIGRIVAQQVPVLYLFNADYVYAYRERLRGFAPNAFVPTWNAYRWRLHARSSSGRPSVAARNSAR